MQFDPKDFTSLFELLAALNFAFVGLEGFRKMTEGLFQMVFAGKQKKLKEQIEAYRTKNEANKEPVVEKTLDGAANQLDGLENSMSTILSPIQVMFGISGVFCLMFLVLIAFYQFFSSDCAIRIKQLLVFLSAMNISLWLALIWNYGKSHNIGICKANFRMHVWLGCFLGLIFITLLFNIYYPFTFGGFWPKYFSLSILLLSVISGMSAYILLAVRLIFISKSQLTSKLRVAESALFDVAAYQRMKTISEPKNSDDLSIQIPPNKKPISSSNPKTKNPRGGKTKK